MNETAKHKLLALLALCFRALGLMKEQVKKLPPLPPAPPTVTIIPSPSRKLFDIAVSCIGKDMAPIEDEFGCAEAVNEIVYKTFGDYAGGGASTYRMFSALTAHKKFKQVSEGAAGDIIISPTGTGNGKLANGHTGIMGENGSIMSNDSVSGFWQQNYSLDTWRARYQKLGGFPVLFFRRTTK